MSDDVCSNTWYQDEDGDDYYGNTMSSATQPPGNGWSNSPGSGGGDCDDDPAQCGAACNPLQEEICDGYDNDCDGTPDNLITARDECFFYTWNGSVSSNWTTAANWTVTDGSHAAPGIGDDIIIPAGMPNNPILSTVSRSCKNLTIKNNAVLTMPSGTLKVYGEIKAPSASCFNLTGGSLVLYHTTEFPPDMVFNNLTINKNSSNLFQDNVTVLKGLVTINGNLVITGSGNLPQLLLNNDDVVFLKKNLSVTGGLIKAEFQPSNGLQEHLPKIFMDGTSTQNLKVLCPGCYVGNGLIESRILADLVINNPAVYLETDLSIYNLILHKKLNLRGKKLYILGKIQYSTDPSVFITNSQPTQGRVDVYNLYPRDDQPLTIKIDKLRGGTFWGSDFTNEVNLEQDITASEYLIINGVLHQNGYNITVGNTTTSSALTLEEPMDNTANAGTLKLIGGASTNRYKINAASLHNLNINSPAGAALDNDAGIDLDITGTATLTKGDFDINGTLVNFSSNLPPSTIQELNGNRFYNSLENGASLIVETANFGISNNFNPAGLGFFISTNNPLNQIKIQRRSEQLAGMNNNMSMSRYYMVYNQTAGTGLNATVKLKYNEAELNNPVSEANLRIFRKVFGDPVWEPIPSSVNVNTNIVSATATLPRIDISSNAFPTVYTLAYDNNPFRNIGDMEVIDLIPLDQNQILLYPNPASDHLEIRMSANDLQSTLDIINMTGSQIINKTINADDSGIYRESLDISSYPEGIYFVRILNESGVQGKKFVKQ